MINPEIDSIGTKRWYNENGLRHRLDGPAVEYVNGKKYWFIQGRELTEADHQLLTFACYNTL